jgi:uncharacterized protein with HEPN domain
VEEYLQDISSLDEFDEDDRSRLAIERCIEIICEASHKLWKNHQIELSLADRAYNFRGSLAHQYDEIRSSKVYNFATTFVPNMLEEAKTLLEGMA